MRFSPRLIALALIFQGLPPALAGFRMLPSDVSPLLEVQVLQLQCATQPAAKGEKLWYGQMSYYVVAAGTYGVAHFQSREKAGDASEARLFCERLACASQFGLAVPVELDGTTLKWVGKISCP